MHPSPLGEVVVVRGLSIWELGAEEMGSVPSRPRRDEDHLYLENQSLV